MWVCDFCDAVFVGANVVALLGAHQAVVKQQVLQTYSAFLDRHAVLVAKMVKGSPGLFHPSGKSENLV